VKFWLACFVLLFFSAELFQWFAELEIGQPSGAWLILGGMGLAAASNAAHLPKLGVKPEAAIGPEIAPPAGASVDAERSPTEKEDSPNGAPDRPLSVAEQSAEDSISFKVRLPWR
jgi:hypothetical protein